METFIIALAGVYLSYNGNILERKKCILILGNNEYFRIGTMNSNTAFSCSFYLLLTHAYNVYNSSLNKHKTLPVFPPYSNLAADDI